ncbi:MAG TPA: class I SAM-dependent methyltransferase, partial [Solirubrobacteraceae bacterium]|nr:class I SAM-dependent methyltransferase [Solirubrobacteraceae bacterium]
MSARRAALFAPDDPRSRPARLLSLTGQALALVRLPPAAILFYAKALRQGRKRGDTVSLAIAARPRELVELVRAARGATAVAEVGTGTAWTAIVLALADRARRIHSFDVREHDGRSAYLQLAPAQARARLELAVRDGREGPPADLPELYFMFIDSSHELEETVTTFRLWSARLRPGGT